MARVENKFISSVTSGSDAPAGTVLTSDGAGNSSWLPLSISSAFAAYASSQITTVSSTVNSTTFVTFDNSPAFTITPTISGTYKIYAPVPVQIAAADGGAARIYETSQLATLLYESQGGMYTAGDSIIDTLYTQSVYSLVAGTTYIFDIQGRSTGAGNLKAWGSFSPFYMFAEGIALSNASPVIAIITGQPQMTYVADTPIIFPTVLVDTNSAYSTITGIYTVPFAGNYQINSSLNTNQTTMPPFYAAVNTTQYGPSIGWTDPTTGFGSGSTIVNALAGDLITIRSGDGWGSSGVNGGFSISLIR